MNLEGGDLGGPDDASLVVVGFDNGGEQALSADAVAAHYGGALLALGVQVGGAQLLRVEGAQLEDLAHLYAASQVHGCAALGFPIAGRGAE